MGFWSKTVWLLFGLALGAAAQSITVAAAANVQYALHPLAERFEERTGISVRRVVASSGKLTAQIEHGAPFDLFLSADMKYPERLYASKKAVTKPRVYALGALVLWTLRPLDLEEGLGVLAGRKVTKVAIPNPRTAPYGKEALRVLKKSGLYERVAPKLIFGESVSQTNRYIVTTAADAGLTAKSALFSPTLKGRGRSIEIDPSLYGRIEQGVVLLAYGRRHHPDASRAFYDFLFSPEGRRILERFGYSLP